MFFNWFGHYRENEDINKDYNRISNSWPYSLTILKYYFPNGTLIGDVLVFIPSLVTFVISRLSNYTDFLVSLPNIQKL